MSANYPVLPVAGGALVRVFASLLAFVTRWLKELVEGRRHRREAKQLVGLDRRIAIVKKVSILRRIFDAIFDGIYESRRRQTDREIANFFAQRGGRITDDLEREMTHRLFTSNWSARE